MKKFHICIIALLVTLVCTAFTQLPFYFNTNQRLAIENQKSIHFMEQEYIFGYGNEIQNEYFPKGESINSFQSLIAVYVFKNQTDPLLTANKLYNKLTAKQQIAQLAIHRFTKEPHLSFILKTSKGLELNLWRFYRNPDHSEVLGLQYLRIFDIPQSFEQQNKLKNSIHTIDDNFMLLPKLEFIW